jgi:hypothetical protein
MGGGGRAAGGAGEQRGARGAGGAACGDVIYHIGVLILVGPLAARMARAQRAESRAWPFLTTQIPGQKPPTGLPAAQRRATGCRRVDEPTSVRKFRVAPRASYVPLDLDRLPARFRAGRSGCCGALFLLHYGFV